LKQGLRWDEKYGRLRQLYVLRAENDYPIARHLLESGEEFAYGVTFHAQQMAEKYIKAFLVWHQIEFKKAHDITFLIESATTVTPELNETLSGTAELAPCGV
jgi:HEPN domain-containing protein